MTAETRPLVLSFELVERGELQQMDHGTTVEMSGCCCGLAVREREEPAYLERNDQCCCCCRRTDIPAASCDESALGVEFGVSHM